MFTDKSIKFALVEERSKKVLRVGQVNLKSGVISNGKITDEGLVTKILGTIFKKHRLHSNLVRLMIPDNNLVIKKITVPKFLKTHDLKSYLKLELEESLQTLPYKDPIIDVKDYKVYNDKDDKDVIIFTTSKEIISSYLKVIQRHRKSVIDSQISPVLIRRLYLDSKGLRNTPEKHIMFTQLRENTHILTVFENELPVLSLRDTFEIDEYDEEFYLEQIVDIVERICHFYKYQFSDNEDVQKIVIYSEIDFSKDLQKEINEKIDVEVEFVTHEGLKHGNAVKNSNLNEYYLPISMSL
jgi:type IV pilus assembly protein PilM